MQHILTHLMSYEKALILYCSPFYPQNSLSHFQNKILPCIPAAKKLTILSCYKISNIILESRQSLTELSRSIFINIFFKLDFIVCFLILKSIFIHIFKVLGAFYLKRDKTNKFLDVFFKTLNRVLLIKPTDDFIHIVR